MPICDAKVASCVLGETIEAFAERFVINLLPESEQPLGRRGFLHGSGCHFLRFVYQRGQFASPPSVKRRQLSIWGALLIQKLSDGA